MHISAVERAGFPRSMKGRSSSTKKCPIEAGWQPKTSGFALAFGRKSDAPAKRGD